MSSLIRELHDQRHQPFAPLISHEPCHIQNDRVARLQSIQHALEIGERTYRRAIDAIDYVAFSHHRLAAGLNANLGYESVWIDLLDEETLNAGQMPVRNELRRQFRKCDPETQCVATRIGFFRSGLCRCQSTRDSRGGRSPSATVAVFFSSLPLVVSLR